MDFFLQNSTQTFSLEALSEREDEEEQKNLSSYMYDNSLKYVFVYEMY